MMTSAQVVETLVTTTDNFPSQESTYPDDQSTLLHILCRGISDHIGLNLLNMKQTNNRGEGLVIILNISSSITTNSHIYVLTTFEVDVLLKLLVKPLAL